MKKFYIIIIDSGWPTTAHQVLEESAGILKGYFVDHHLAILTHAESQDFLKDHPNEIIKDPIIIITDTNPKRYDTSRELSGLRIDLGGITDRQEVIKYLQDICVLIKNETFISDISWEERKKIARSFFKDIVGDILIKTLGAFV